MTEDPITELTPDEQVDLLIGELVEANAEISDLGGRASGAREALLAAGWALRNGEAAEAWASVLQAVDALEQPGGLRQAAAALAGAAWYEGWINATPDERHRPVGVVSARWDDAAGAWRVEVWADGEGEEALARAALAVVAGEEPTILDYGEGGEL